MLSLVAWLVRSLALDEGAVIGGQAAGKRLVDRAAQDSSARATGLVGSEIPAVAAEGFGDRVPGPVAGGDGPSAFRCDGCHERIPGVCWSPGSGGGWCAQPVRRVGKGQGAEIVVDGSPMGDVAQEAAADLRSA